MKWRSLVVICAAFGMLAASPALARSKSWHHHHKAYRVSQACAPRPAPFSWGGLLFNPRPGPNGCAPPVYEFGEYIGQDPDPFIRLQLRRDPATGYAYDLAH